jgi:hypothetical protein
MQVLLFPPGQGLKDVGNVSHEDNGVTSIFQFLTGRAMTFILFLGKRAREDENIKK